jgi:hypothetical protein
VWPFSVVVFAPDGQSGGDVVEGAKPAGVQARIA